MDELRDNMLLEALKNDWQGFANKFIPQYKENVMYVHKNAEECYMLDIDKVTEVTRRLTMIRNCLENTKLKRNFKDCTHDEIVQDKYKRLMNLLERRPYLRELVNARL